MPAHRAPRRPASSIARPDPQATSSSLSPAPTPRRWCMATYSRQLVGSLRVANSTARRPQPSSTPRQLSSSRVEHRRILRHGRDLGRAGPGMTGSSDRPRSTRPSPCPQCRSADRHREGELREPAEERPEGQLALHAGQRRTETVMDAVPEGEMTGLVPVEVERLGAGVSVCVPVGRRQADDHLFTGGYLPRHRESTAQPCSETSNGGPVRRSEGTPPRPWESSRDRRGAAAS